VALTLLEAVRVYVLNEAASTAHVPQAEQIADALGHSIDEIRAAIRALAAARALVLAPNDGEIWAAEPFCARPTNFQVVANARHYWALCIWDALGIPAALGTGAVIDTSCGDCGERMELEVRSGALTEPRGVVHFGVPARRFWDNIAFT